MSMRSSPSILPNSGIFKATVFLAAAHLLGACAGTVTQEQVEKMVETAVVPADDSRCPMGGVEVRIGADTNANKVLEDGEVTSSDVVCNGTAGAAGKDGATGAPGPMGDAGQDGTSCTVSKDADAGVTTISCADGTTAVVPDGQTGATGLQGPPGVPAQRPSRVCGLTTSFITSGRVEYQNETGLAAVDRACADVCNDPTAVICDAEALQRSLQASPPLSPRSLAGSLPIDAYDRVASWMGESGIAPTCDGFSSADPYNFGPLAMCSATRCTMFYEYCDKTFAIVCCH